MATAKQALGEFGETQVTKHSICMKCKRQKTLKRLRTNFKCADLICDFCGYLAQVKATKVSNINQLPKTVLGAAWGPQKERMDSGIYFPLFIVLTTDSKSSAIYDLSPDFQQPGMFIPRKPLSSTAKRSGWQGFMYDLSQVEEQVIRLT